jgi:hypothetical protein
VTPHLIHVGFAKAGSTILQRWFAEHPQIAFSRSGVLGLGSVFDISRAAAAAARPPLLRVTSEESLATPHAGAGQASREVSKPKEHVPQADAERVCEALAGMFPDAWILIVTRGFREVMLSSYSQYVKSGGTDPFFALNPEFGGAGHRSRGVWDYDRVIELYRGAFPGRVLVLPYELLRDDPDRFLALVEAPFGLEHVPLPAGVVNPSLAAVELAWYPRFSGWVRRIPLPGRLARRLLRDYHAALGAGRWRRLANACQRLWPRQPVTGDMIPEEVLARFAGKVNRLREDPLFRPYAEDYRL